MSIPLNFVKDDKNVFLLSTFAGEQPNVEVKRCDRKQEKQVPCPAYLPTTAILGNVDLLD